MNSSQSALPLLSETDDQLRPMARMHPDRIGTKSPVVTGHPLDSFYQRDRPELLVALQTKWQHVRIMHSLNKSSSSSARTWLRRLRKHSASSNLPGMTQSELLLPRRQHARSMILQLCNRVRNWSYYSCSERIGSFNQITLIRDTGHPISECQL